MCASWRGIVSTGEVLEPLMALFKFELRSNGQPRAAVPTRVNRLTIFPPTMVATTFPVSCQPSKGVFLDFESDLAASKVHFLFGSNTVTSATEPRTREPRPRRSKQRAGPAVKSSTMRASGMSLLAMQSGDRQRERGFKSGDAERRALEFHLLFVGGVGSVIGGDGVDRAVGERGQDGFAIGGRAQRRIHLEIAVVVAHVLVAQREMVGSHFKRDARLGALAAAHTFQRIGCGKMSNVQASVGMCIASCTSRSTIEASAAAVMPRNPRRNERAPACMEQFSSSCVFGMLHDGKIQLSAQSQRLAHDAVVENGLAIVGDGDRLPRGAARGNRSA